MIQVEYNLYKNVIYNVIQVFINLMLMLDSFNQV